jgi:hypothetical protein
MYYLVLRKTFEQNKISTLGYGIVKTCHITAIVRLPKMIALLDLPFFLGLGCVGGEMSNLEVNFIN